MLGEGDGQAWASSLHGSIGEMKLRIPFRRIFLYMFTYSIIVYELDPPLSLHLGGGGGERGRGDGGGERGRGGWEGGGEGEGRGRGVQNTKYYIIPYLCGC